jgi:type IV secretion system protein VirB10
MTVVDAIAEPATAPAPDVEATPALGRTISPIAGRFGTGTAGKVVTLAALAVGCGVFILATGHHGPRRAKAPIEPAAQVVPFEAANPDPVAGRPLDTTSKAPVLDASGAGTVPALQTGAGANGAQSAQAAAEAAAQARAAHLQAIRSAPILAFNQSGGTLLGSLPPAGLTLPGVEPAHAASELDQLRQGSAIGLVRASRLPDRHFLITAGTSIPCTLQTAMDTATPGYVSCIVGQDVYSDDGAVVLMDKGSKVLGEYRSGMRQGQSRLFVLWTRAVTPGGVAIGLASPASDALGRAGFDGAIDTHFWDRFGGALLLSIVDDSSAALSARTGQNGETIRMPSDAAGIALQNSINVPPDLKKPQGSQVAIFVAQDLDFSSVYALRTR